MATDLTHRRRHRRWAGRLRTGGIFGILIGFFAGGVLTEATAAMAGARTRIR